jgi:hypothetical protein
MQRLLTTTEASLTIVTGAVRAGTVLWTDALSAGRKVRAGRAGAAGSAVWECGLSRASAR